MLTRRAPSEWAIHADGQLHHKYNGPLNSVHDLLEPQKNKAIGMCIATTMLLWAGFVANTPHVTQAKQKTEQVQPANTEVTEEMRNRNLYRFTM